MRRRFENVNMVMGNCFSPVMEGSQFHTKNYQDTFFILMKILKRYIHIKMEF